ncbi:MAG: glucosamine-6-phosphate deaminase, partial [Atopostipes suicloacalis]|nr:glucosamine-6-phosphate deaminase [Atopostipes suicloacalis]
TIDLQILGIGEYSHIGFNEPGTAFDSNTELVDLTESTINANKRNFDSVEDVPTQAISMGIGSIMKAKKIVLIAYGEKKADAIKNMIEGPVTEDVPASILQKHDNVVVILDDAAAKKLDQ